MKSRRKTGGVQLLQEAELVGSNVRVGSQVGGAMPTDEEFLNLPGGRFNFEGSDLSRDTTGERPGAQEPTVRCEAVNEGLRIRRGLAHITN